MRCIVPVVLACALWVAAGPTAGAGAYPGELTPVQAPVTASGMPGARGVVVSPDGANVYVAGASASAVAAFARAADGKLTPIGCIADVGAPTSCAAHAEGLAAPQYLAISPDGKNVYAAGGGADNAVVTLDRAPGSGLLSAAGCSRDVESASTNCGTSTAPALAGAEGVVVSPDGRNVYVAAQGDSAVSTFARDPATGALTYGSCISSGAVGCGATTPAPGDLLYPRGATIAPDGLGVYIAGANSGVAAFRREPSTGALTWVQSTAELAPALVVGVAVSPDGSSVYAGSVNRSAVFGFRRDVTTAMLTAAGCVKDPSSVATCAATSGGMPGTEGVVVAPDGASLYSTSFYGSALATFARNPVDGLLSPTGCFRDVTGLALGCSTLVEGLGSSRAVTTSPDGRTVYATGQGDAAVAVFARELPPPGPPAPPGGAPPPAAGGTPPTPAAAKAPPTVRFASVVTLPAAKRCVSRRAFPIRLRQPRGAVIVSAVVRVNGRRVTTRRGKRVLAPIDLRGLPKGKVKVAITVTLADGRTVQGSRTYRTCAPRKR